MRSAVLDMKDTCIEAIRPSRASDSELLCPWLSVEALLHVCDCLMWEHCPLLIPFCTLSEASTSQADWQIHVEWGLLKCYKAITLSFDNFFFGPLFSHVTTLDHLSCEFRLQKKKRCLMFWISCWHAIRLPAPKCSVNHIEKEFE